MAEILIPLEPDKFYHIYNHAVGKENFFETGADYEWFLEKFIKYAVPVCDVFAFSLMPNHFHFVIRVKGESEIIPLAKMRSIKIAGMNDATITQGTILTETVSRQFSHLFNSYAKYFNYIHLRKGTLFTRAFRRKWVESEDYLKQLICYIHQNPVEAGFCNKPDQWKYSSYNAITGLKNTLVCRKEVIELFDDVENFIFCSSKKADVNLVLE